MRTVVVTGATGNIGSELVRLLSRDRGVRVVAVSRSPPRGTGPEGIEWVTADLADRAALRPILEPADRLFLSTGNEENMVRLQKNAIAAAVEAGVRHVVKVSALGASDHSKSVIGLWHYNIERALRESRLEWTILRPHVFMQNLLDQRDRIRTEGRIYTPAGDARIPMIDTRDIAAVAAAVLTGDGHAEKRYTLTGPEAISHPEAARILSDELGAPLACVTETEDQAWHRLHGAGLPVWLIGAQLALAEYQRRGGGTDIITDAVREITGRSPRTFHDFARDHAAAFRDR